ncbi:PDZ domain-containing protein [Pelotomaculum propionicicum]|uniref:PDZ domain-containing protein n=1 Tax=Pelotomaculum propionicicum TaxID=258475 RepID=UPI003B7AFE56
MFPFLQLIPITLQAFLQTFIDPAYLFLYLVVCVIIAIQYNRMEKLRENFFGARAGRTRKDFLAAIGYGLLGGLLGSYLVIFVGLTISGELYYLWPVAILLMMINIRFLCFAYAGGILALSNLIFGVPQINPSQILALVAALHMVESFLIFAGGHLGAVPAYIKGPEGKIIGGFTLQRFWPIPIVVLAVITGGMADGGIEMPGWWPLIMPGVEGNPQDLIFALLPLVAGLGYGDIAIARTPAEKSRLSSLFLGLYSLVLLALAVLAGHNRAVALLAALFSPLGHEAVIYIGKWFELKGEPIYVPAAEGMRLLDVLPDGPAWRAGLRPGDVITAVNGVKFTDRTEFYNLLQSSFLPPGVDYISRAAGAAKNTVIKPPEPGKAWGLAPVPESNEGRYVELLTVGPLGRWILKLWGKTSR